jgi:hypothetical protein
MSYNLKVSESYAMDFLAILRIKSHQTKTEESQRLFDECYLSLLEQGGENFLAAYRSDLYLDLIQANLDVFNMVNQIKKGGIDARVVDELNYERYLAKQAIQDKFFGGGKSEEKLGYNKE